MRAELPGASPPLPAAASPPPPLPFLREEDEGRDGSGGKVDDARTASKSDDGNGGERSDVDNADLAMTDATVPVADLLVSADDNGAVATPRGKKRRNIEMEEEEGVQEEEAAVEEEVVTVAEETNDEKVQGMEEGEEEKTALTSPTPVTATRQRRQPQEEEVEPREQGNEEVPTPVTMNHPFSATGPADMEVDTTSCDGEKDTTPEGGMSARIAEPEPAFPLDPPSQLPRDLKRVAAPVSPLQPSLGKPYFFPPPTVTAATSPIESIRALTKPRQKGTSVAEVGGNAIAEGGSTSVSDIILTGANAIGDAAVVLSKPMPPQAEAQPPLQSSFQSIENSMMAKTTGQTTSTRTKPCPLLKPGALTPPSLLTVKKGPRENDMSRCNARLGEGTAAASRKILGGPRSIVGQMSTKPISKQQLKSQGGARQLKRLAKEAVTKPAMQLNAPVSIAQTIPATVGTTLLGAGKKTNNEGRDKSAMPPPPSVTPVSLAGRASPVIPEPGRASATNVANGATKMPLPALDSSVPTLKPQHPPPERHEVNRANGHQQKLQSHHELTLPLAHCEPFSGGNVMSDKVTKIQDDLEDAELELSSPYDDSWMKESDAMLVHMQRLQEQTEDMAHAAAEALVDAQVCANELHFLYTPKVMLEINTMRDEAERILDEYEEMFGVADDPTSATDTSPTPLLEAWESVRASESLSLSNEQDVEDIELLLRTLAADESWTTEATSTLEDHLAAFQEKQRCIRGAMGCMDAALHALRCGASVAGKSLCTGEGVEGEDRFGAAPIVHCPGSELSDDEPAAVNKEGDDEDKVQRQ